MPLNVGLRSCGALCPHPGCWDAVRKQQKGITKSLPPLDFSSSDDSDSELDLPTQSVCNLLADFGESPTDRYPVSTGGRPSHQLETPLPIHSEDTVAKRKESTFSPKKLQAPHNTKASIFSKYRSTAGPAPRPGRPRQPRMPLVEVQEVFDCTDLNSQWDETFVTKQYYIWVANPHKKKKRRIGGHGLETQRDNNAPVLVKDMTECMVPPEIEQQREDTVLKKQPRTCSPPSKSLQFKKAAMSQPPALPAPPPVDVDMEGINELLALPKDVLLKVLENTKKSDFTLKGKIHEIVQECVEGNETARMMLSTRELLRQKKMKILNIPKGSVHKSLPAPLPKPVFHVDDEHAMERMSSVNTHVKDKDACSDDSSVESFPHYRKPLPKIQGHSNLSYHLVGPGELIQAQLDPVRLPIKAKLPSISLGLPELPSGVKTTRAFSYNNRNSMVDFSLGPVISPPTTHRSSESGDYSEHGTTVKVNAPMSGLGFAENELIHAVSPALSTNVPLAPAGTPATFMSPTKSAPNLRDISRDPTQATVNLSVRAQLSSSKDMREATFMSSPTTGQPLNYQHSVSPLHDPTKFPMTPDDKGLDTIRETAREMVGVDGSLVSSSHGTPGDKIGDQPKLVLQTSTMTNINTGASPHPKSARSVESCPSPEQWPLISESSFEKMLPRSSVSEPALSGRSGRRPLSRSLDDARKVMVEKNSAESPAPPPPSPEPKDSNEYRARKDLKSRDSLSMAPLFEVNEIDEEAYNDVERDGRRKQVRKIHAVIPQANTDDDNNNNNYKKEDEYDQGEDEEVMVSQITVMHVAPKGITADESVQQHQGAGNVKREKEKVQETFLNVDIPAEEISSCKAEHGSSRQEDISSTNDSPDKSEATTTNSQVSTSLAGKVNDEEDDGDDDNDGGEGKQYEEYTHVGEREEVEGETQGTIVIEGKDTLEERQYLEMQSDMIHRDRNDSAKFNSEDSGVSPELVCDSARFMSHDLVSPIEGEMDEGQLQMMSLLQQVEGGGTMTLEKTRSEPGGEETKIGEVLSENDGHENDGQDADLMAEEYGKILGEMENVGDREILGEESPSQKGEDCLEDSGKDGRENSAESKATHASDIEPPGSFFFQNNGADMEGTDTMGTAEFVVDLNTEEKVENTESDAIRERSNEETKQKEDAIEESVINFGATQDLDEKIIRVDTEKEGKCVDEKSKETLEVESENNADLTDNVEDTTEENNPEIVGEQLIKTNEEESVGKGNISTEKDDNEKNVVESENNEEGGVFEVCAENSDAGKEDRDSNVIVTEEANIESEIKNEEERPEFDVKNPIDGDKE